MTPWGRSPVCSKPFPTPTSPEDSLWVQQRPTHLGRLGPPHPLLPGHWHPGSHTTLGPRCPKPAAAVPHIDLNAPPLGSPCPRHLLPLPHVSLRVQCRAASLPRWRVTEGRDWGRRGCCCTWAELLGAAARAGCSSALRHQSPAARSLSPPSHPPPPSPQSLRLHPSARDALPADMRSYGLTCRGVCANVAFSRAHPPLSCAGLCPPITDDAAGPARVVLITAAKRTRR